MKPPGPLPSVAQLAQAGAFSPLEREVARTLTGLAQETDPWVELATALAVWGPRNGQVCVSLREPPALNEGTTSEGGNALGPWHWPLPEQWAETLRRSRLVGDGLHPTPLVLDDHLRLYLYRYYQYEKRLLAALQRRAALPPTPTSIKLLREGLRRLFPTPGPVEDGQRQAAVMAVLRALTVISGGPGTGKTTTVVKILALLQEQTRRCHPGRFPLRIILLAPTGKAAARLAESIRRSRDQLPLSDEIRDAIPTDAATIHRQLGYQPYHPSRFFHDEANPLPADVVVVDECSMVDLALMTKLVEAVPASSRLMLLGDRDQLAAVEAGAVFSDLCPDQAPGACWSPEWRSFVQQVLAETVHEPAPPLPEAERMSPMADCVCHLDRSFRFDPDSGIGALARATHQGDVGTAFACLQQGGDVDWIPVPGNSPPHPVQLPGLAAQLVRGYRPYLSDRDPAGALNKLGQFRVLCTLRRGRFGVEQFNELIQRLLARQGLLDPRGGWAGWYPGRPVMICRNDTSAQLFNGDIGVVCPDEEHPGRLRVHFPTATEGRTRSSAPALLPPAETAFAMTVHKSQGSEFDEVLLVLPLSPSPLVTRELLYTGVTRARHRVTVVGPAGVLEASLVRRVQRTSGLRQALWPSEPPSTTAFGRAKEL